MKTRNGLVSNSSSSSFVILGIKSTDKEVVDKAGELGLYYDWIEGEDYFVIGGRIKRWTEEDKIESMTFDEVQKKAAHLTDILTKLDLKEPQPIQLFYGTVY